MSSKVFTLAFCGIALFWAGIIGQFFSVQPQTENIGLKSSQLAPNSHNGQKRDKDPEKEIASFTAVFVKEEPKIIEKERP